MVVAVMVMPVGVCGTAAIPVMVVVARPVMVIVIRAHRATP